MKTQIESPGQNTPELPHSMFELPDAEPWPEPVVGKSLLAALVALFRRFVILPEWAAETLALWVLHTYSFQYRNVSTYLGIESPEKRCGKTTLLTVLSELVHRPVVAANISPPALFRVIQETRPTLLIDEADTLLLGNDELRGILNSGYTRKTAYVVRVAHSPPAIPPKSEISNLKSPGAPTSAPEPHAAPESDSRITLLAPRSTLHAPRSTLARFSCWCPKVMAAIGRLPDTLADRCLILRMNRKTASEQCARLRDLDPSDLRRQCARFALDHAPAIAAAHPEIPSILHDRAADIWEPLFALADLADGDWPRWARQAAISLSVRANDSNPIGSLLLDIFLLFINGKVGRLSTRDLLDGLNGFTDRPWIEMRKGKQLTDLWLSQTLRPYGVRPKTIRLGSSTAKGYLQEDFMDVFRRYIPRSEIEACKERAASESAALDS